MTRDEALKAIKTAKRVFVFTSLNREDGMHFQVTKAEAIHKLNHWQDDLPFARMNEGDLLLN